MSLAIAEPMRQRAGADPGELPAGISTRAVAFSAALHVVLGALLIIGLPRLFSPPQPEELPTTVQLVTIAPETRATRPNLNPRPEAKPELPDVEPPAARPEPKPEPPKPAPVPPPAAAASPAPEAAKP
ncbi:MAG: cell envelope integrity protein TolA, partial [Alphaproteobacteria bacterium]|nr:cell envelope integrity protein TolA [Alphaproteobacteria bacterium]